jgi:hypothetical protein
MSDLVLERREQANETPVFKAGDTALMMTPPISDDYWEYRVMVGEGQAIVGFPKFMTIGIGFAVEDDWNTNLPFTCEAEEIWKHIRHNKGNDSIPDEWCIEAIRLVQEAARNDRGES